MVRLSIATPISPRYPLAYRAGMFIGSTEGNRELGKVAAYRRCAQAKAEEDLGPTPLSLRYGGLRPAPATSAPGRGRKKMGATTVQP
jgi:hypothetical protein